MAKWESHWQPYTKQPFTRGGSKKLGTLVANGRGAYLIIGALLRQKGFDVNEQYELLFDRKRFAIGLKATKTGFLVTHHGNGTGTSVSHSVRMTGFCNRFDLHDRYDVRSAKLEGDIWVLRLEKT